MNLKRIIIAITVVLIGTGNINAQDMKTEVPKISDFPVGEENTGYAQYFTFDYQQRIKCTDVQRYV